MTEITELTGVPTPTPVQKKVPTPSKKKKEIPTPTELSKEVPKIEHEENCIRFGDRLVEIKPTKLKYFRNRTASIYSALKLVP